MPGLETGQMAYKQNHFKQEDGHLDKWVTDRGLGSDEQ